MLNDGLFTFCVIPFARAKHFTNAVFPAPKPPESATEKSPPATCAKDKARAFVLSSDSHTTPFASFSRMSDINYSLEQKRAILSNPFSIVESATA